MRAAAWPVLAEDANGPVQFITGNPYVLYGVLGAGALLLLILLGALLRKKPPAIDPEEGMSEDLSTYPPAPARSAGKQLTVQGSPVRVRFVVIAPIGRQAVEGGPEEILEQVVRGMGQAARGDRPRVRQWPLGFSNAGFTPMFFRRVVRPEPAGSPSHWVLLAGQARAGARQLLLGLALWSEQPTTLGNIAVGPDEWNELLRTETMS